MDISKYLDMAQNNNNNSDDGLIIVVFVLIIMCVLGYFGYPILKEYFLTVKMWQLEIISRVVPIEYNVNLLNELKNKPSYDWTFMEMAKLGYTINYYFLPLILILFFAMFTLTKDKLYTILKFSKVYTKETLLMQEKKVWKFLEPVAHKNLLFNKSPEWASAKKAQEIVFEFNLLNNKKDLLSLNEEKARKYFAMQLGDLYTNINDLKPYQKAIVGCFAAHIKHQKDDAYYALMDIAESFGKDANGKINFQPGFDLFEKYKDDTEINKILSKHAYVNTAMAGLMDHAKDKGILLTRYFIWLKEYDRKLFYILNIMGRNVPFIEAAGIFDHYQHEVGLDRPMAKLFVQEAVNGLKEELKNVKLTTVK